MTNPIDPFWSPPTRESRPLVEPPVRWHARDDHYWVADGDLLYPLHTMPLGCAQRLLAALNEQAEADLLAAFRDLPLLAALHRHIDRLARDKP